MINRKIKGQMDKTEILYGTHPVMEALKAGRRRFFEIYVTNDKEVQKHNPVLALSQKRGIPVKGLPSGQIRALCQSDKHQNTAAKVSPYPYVSLSLKKQSETGSPALLVLLDHIQDPMNLGAVIRSALCVGADYVIIPKDRSAGATPAVSSASAGALEHIRLAQVTNLVHTVENLKQNGVWIYGLDRSGRESVYGVDFTAPTGIIIGGEEKGIRPLVQKSCDQLVFIPQVGEFNSLNASVAGAVVLYEAFRQRNAIYNIRK